MSLLITCMSALSAATHANKSATLKRTGIDSKNQQLADELHKPVIKKL